MAVALTIKLKCRVPLCELNHEEHFCRLCTEQDTDHFSTECPKSKTLYHGTQVEHFKPISSNGLKESKGGRLGQGVYFVDCYNKAKRISKNRQKLNDSNSVVIECQVYLGKHRDLGNKSEDTWQKNYDSASSMHPPWCGLGTFKEYCLKDSKKCLMKTLYMNGEPIKKDANMSWGEAQQVINQLAPNATSGDFNKALEKIKLLNLKTEHNNDDEPKMPQVPKVQPMPKVPPTSKVPRWPKMPRWPKVPKVRGPLKYRHVRWMLKRWYMFVKTISTLFFISNAIWSAVHLNRQDDRSVIPFVFFVILLFFQSITNLIYLVEHWRDCIHDPYKINKNVTLSKFLIALFLEMPMLVTQASIIKSINKDQPTFIWDDFSWDIALQFQFVFNMVLFLTIDIPYQARKIGRATWLIPAAFCLSFLVSALVFAPVHLTQLGFIWRPDLNDFGGNITDTNTQNILSVSMYVGAAGLWTWPVTFPTFCLALMFKGGIQNFGASLKFVLVQFNILNGVWSIVHLYQLGADVNSKKAMRGFATCFVLQACSNLALIIHNFALDFPCKKLESRTMIIAKLVIALVFEMPMLSCQAFAMQNMDNLVWSDLNWDVGIHLQFMINLILFVAVDVVSDDNKWKCIPVPLTMFYIVPVMYMPVYQDFVGPAVRDNSIGIF